MFLKIFIVITIFISPCICPCGRYHRVITTLKYSKNRVKLTVVNGEPVDQRKLPYLVSIKEPAIDNDNPNSGTDKTWMHLCGGSIITIRGEILTAAHCFEANRFFYAKRPHLLRVVAGSTDTDIVHSGQSGASPSGIQWRRLIEAHLHPEFQFPLNDIAVVKIDVVWGWNPDLKPISLSKETTEEQSCYTAGYGRVGHGDSDVTSSVLLMAPMEIIPRDMCTESWEMNMDRFVCTSSANTDVSEGDSGSPLTCDMDGNTLVGVVCGKNFDKTTIYTRVSAFVDWINNISSPSMTSNLVKLYKKSQNIQSSAPHTRLAWTITTFNVFTIVFMFSK